MENKPPPELDELTLRRAQRGDRAASHALVIRYQRPVFALLGRMLAQTSTPHLLEDLAQETFLRAFRSLSSFDTKRGVRLSTWILTIATNIALDHAKRFAPKTVPLEEAFELASEDTTDSLAERRSLGAMLEQAVSRLSPVYRAVFILREYHELSYEEISQTLQIDVGTVKSRLLRARTALRQALQEVI
jgi:RNA polymerase sigma-70 factor (ECF subfamily)